MVVVTDGGDCCGEVTDGDDGYGCGNRGWYGFLILDTELSLFIALAKFISLFLQSSSRHPVAHMGDTTIPTHISRE